MSTRRRRYCIDMTVMHAPHLSSARPLMADLRTGEANRDINRNRWN